jgi:peptidoglycan/LPS O-acetylase OafA/YrhL
MLGARLPPVFRPAIWLGKISYGLYVYQLPCIMLSVVVAERVFHVTHNYSLFTYVLGFPLTVAFAATSYHFLEMPFLRRKARFEIVQSRTT